MKNLASAGRTPVLGTRTRAVSLAFISVLVTFAMNVPVEAATATFTDEATFLIANAYIANLESFENLPATNSYTATEFVLGPFLLDIPDTPGNNLGVWDIPFAGGFATHGTNWIGFQSDTNERLRWTFYRPINAFGLNITDWGDFGSGQFVFSNDAGDAFTVAVTPQSDGNQMFFGVINDSMSFTTVVLNQNIPGEFYGVDEIYSSLGGCPTPANVLVSQGLPVQGSYEYFYGGDRWSEMTAFIDAAAASVTVVSNLENLGVMLAFDALWVDQRDNDSNPAAELTPTEVANIIAFMNTGRRVVMIGENSLWSDWNNQLLGTVGGSFDVSFSGIVNTVNSRLPTIGVDTIDLLSAGTANGGQPLFDQNFSTLWQPTRNVLTVLDVNVWSEGLADEDNAVFANNVAKWIGCSVWQEYVFSDDFESGDTSAWTSAVP